MTKSKTILLVVAVVMASAAYAHNSRVESFNSCFNVLMAANGVKYPTSMDRHNATFLCGKPGLVAFN